MKQTIFTIILVLALSFAAFAQTSTNTICPKTEPSGGIVEAGTPMKFIATLSGVTGNPALEYEWKVSAGTILSGQGTCAISVDTTGLADGTNITAEVTIKGLPEKCPNTASETGSVVVNKIIGEPLDRFGRLPRDEVRGRLDALFVALGNEPNSQGSIINYGTEQEIIRREALIRDHIRLRRFDAGRITFARGGATQRSDTNIWTVIWIVPPGAEFPKPDNE